MGGACGNCSCDRDAHRNMNTQPNVHTMPDAGMLKNKRRRSTEYRRMLSQNRSVRLSTSPYTSNGEGPPETSEMEEPSSGCKEIDDIDEDEEMMGYSETEEDTSMTTSTTTSPPKIDHKEKGKIFRANTSRKWNVQELDDATQDMEGALLRLMKKSSGGTNRSDYLYSDSAASTGSHISAISLERSKSNSLPAVSTRSEVMERAKRATMSPNGRGKKFRGHILDIDSPHFGYESRTTSSSAQTD